MADNVAITAGSGTSIATDDCGAGGHTQVVKLAISTDASATLIPADATDGIAVNPFSVGASTINSTSSDGGTALTNSAQAIKASAGRLMGYYIFNPNTATVWVQVYNTASGSVTVGTTNPLFALAIPAGSAANLWMGAGGPTFGTAISWSATSTSNGNGAPTTALDAVAWYK